MIPQRVIDLFERDWRQSDGRTFEHFTLDELNTTASVLIEKAESHHEKVEAIKAMIKVISKRQ